VLGYELDLTQCTPAEKKAIAAQVAYYKQNRQLLQYGTFYRLLSPFEREQCSWLVVDQTGENAMVLDAIGRLTPNSETPPLRLKGLDPQQCYRLEVRPELMDVRDFGSLINHVLPVRVNSSGLLVRTVAQHYMMPAETEQYEAWGDLLMYAGLKQFQRFTGTGYTDEVRMMPDYAARLYRLQAKTEEPVQTEQEETN
ncbi:MAG: GH36 C-terminal domain-containing protein, partial [Faecalibacterium sp.]|nr:GH36 C-terminal domain-containing protein [Faecalibacterium sp.]